MTTPNLYFALWALLSPLGLASDYRFSLDGSPCDPGVLPVYGERLGKPAAGDVGSVNGFPIVLRDPGHYRFRIDESGQKLFAQIDDGQERLVALRHASPGETHAADLFANVTPDEQKSLWGVHLESLPPDWSEFARGVDWSRAVLSIRGKLPLDSALPPGARYFSFVADGDPTSGSLPSMDELRYLNVELRDGDRLSASPLARATQLRNLNITGGKVSDLQVLRHNTRLRFLKLRSIEGLDSLEFAKHLPHLRVLKVDGADVSDPGPLAGLEDLRLLSLNETHVATLPPLDSLPALRDLRLHSTPVADKSALIEPIRSKLNVLIKNWDPAIRGFEKHDQRSAPPDDPILFVGSSSIRTWDLKAAFPGRPVLNRGFGGSELSDALRYFDRIVLPYEPRAIVLYAGDNDINNGETAEQVVADYRSFARKVRSKLPRAHFAFLPIKPSPSRWELWPEMSKANKAIRTLAEADRHLHYLDTATPLLGEDGRPRPELFADDNLHLNEKGFALWNEVVSTWLHSTLD